MNVNDIGKRKKMEFLKQFNDYSAIYEEICESEMAHYTSFQGGEGILDSKCIYARRMEDFKIDENEGRVSLKKCYKLLKKENVVTLTKNQLEFLDRYIGTSERIEEYIKNCPSYVACFSLNIDSNYMQKKFQSDAMNEKERGRNFEIVFDAKKFLDEMYILDRENNKHYCVHKGRVIYDIVRQEEIIRQEIKALWPLLVEDSLPDEVAVEYLLRKIYFLGTYFKVPGDKVSVDEEELRILVDLKSDEQKKIMELPEILEGGVEPNKYCYIKIYFELPCIKRVCIYGDKREVSKEVESVKKKMDYDIEVHIINDLLEG